MLYYNVTVNDLSLFKGLLLVSSCQSECHSFHRMVGGHVFDLFLSVKKGLLQNWQFIQSEYYGWLTECTYRTVLINLWYTCHSGDFLSLKSLKAYNHCYIGFCTSCGFCLEQLRPQSLQAHPVCVCFPVVGEFD